MVTAPVLARARPSSVAPVLKVMDCMARTVPLKDDVVPNVAELPTCQKILEASAPPLKMTLRPEVVVSVVAICRMKMASGFPFASNVRSPEEIANEDDDLYSPGVRVSPPRFPDNNTISVEVLPAASLYAAVKSSFAWLDTTSLICCVPFRIPGGNPPMDEPGLKPISPVMLVAPVLVIVEPARTAIPDADPSDKVAWLVVCTGITIGLLEAGSGSLLSHPPNRKAEVISTVVRRFVVFMFLIFHCEGIFTTRQRWDLSAA